MTVENYEHIYYRDHPHFTVGHVDQWGEGGYLLYEDMVFSYEEDRKCQYGRTYSPMNISEFLGHATKYKIDIPEFFMALLQHRLDQRFVK